MYALFSVAPEKKPCHIGWGKGVSPRGAMAHTFFWMFHTPGVRHSLFYVSKLKNMLNNEINTNIRHTFPGLEGDAAEEPMRVEKDITAGFLSCSSTVLTEGEYI